MMVLVIKIVSNISLKTFAILAKRLILDAWLHPERASADWYIKSIKIHKKTSKDGVILTNYFLLKFKP